MKKIDKKFLFENYGSNTKVREVLEFIKDDKNWIYNLFDFVEKRVRLFIKDAAYPDIEIEQKLILMTFGNSLLSIVESINEEYLTSIYPLRKKYSPKDNLDKEKGADVIGLIPLYNYDSRRLIRKTVRELVNRHLNTSKLFLDRLKLDESTFLREYHSLFKEKQSLKDDISILMSQLDKMNQIISTSKFKSKTSKSKVGAKPKFQTKEEFLEAINRVPKDKLESGRKTSKFLGISPGTLKTYTEKYPVDIPKK
jgi:hypothetical protein